MSQGVKDMMDAIAGLFTIGVLAKLVPIVYGVVAIAWYGVRFYDRFVKGKKDGNE